VAIIVRITHAGTLPGGCVARKHVRGKSFVSSLETRWMEHNMNIGFSPGGRKRLEMGTMIDASLSGAVQLTGESWLQIRCKCSKRLLETAN
jgi:hypothetical protein